MAFLYFHKKEERYCVGNTLNVSRMVVKSAGLVIAKCAPSRKREKACSCCAFFSMARDQTCDQDYVLSFLAVTGGVLVAFERGDGYWEGETADIMPLLWRVFLI